MGAQPQSDDVRWDVRIQFDDGEHQAYAWAESKLTAYKLALWDARLASPFGSFFGQVKSWDAVPAN